MEKHTDRGVPEKATGETPGKLREQFRRVVTGTPWRLLSLPGKILAAVLALAVLYIVFCRLDWPAVLNYPDILRLRDNLDFLGACIDRYPWLAAAAMVLIPLILLMGRFSLNSTTFTVLGLELQFRQTESAVKAQIKNFLSAKRAVFVFYEEYDNYYDCINSMYKTLVFLNEQLETFERFSQTNTDSYEHIEGMIQEIGRFLTKYQSDYRRYYETELERMSVNGLTFIPFHEIQDMYGKSREMAADFYRLNERMAEHAAFFDIDIDKWKWDEWQERRGRSAEEGRRMELGEPAWEEFAGPDEPEGTERPEETERPEGTEAPEEAESAAETAREVEAV